jgi:hypothetical protein
MAHGDRPDSRDRDVAELGKEPTPEQPFIQFKSLWAKVMTTVEPPPREAAEAHLAGGGINVAPLHDSDALAGDPCIGVVLGPKGFRDSCRVRTVKSGAAPPGRKPVDASTRATSPRPRSFISACHLDLPQAMGTRSNRAP